MSLAPPRPHRFKRFVVERAWLIKSIGGSEKKLWQWSLETHAGTILGLRTFGDFWCLGLLASFLKILKDYLFHIVSRLLFQVIYLQGGLSERPHLLGYARLFNSHVLMYLYTILSEYIIQSYSMSCTFKHLFHPLSGLIRKSCC